MPKYNDLIPYIDPRLLNPSESTSTNTVRRTEKPIEFQGSNGMVNVNDTVVSLIPGLGDAMDLINIGQDIADKNYSKAALGLGLLFVPNILEKPIKVAAKKLKTFKFKTLDPNSNTVINESTDEWKDIYDYYSSKSVQDKAKQVDKKLGTKYYDTIQEYLKLADKNPEKFAFMNYSNESLKSAREGFLAGEQGANVFYLSELIKEGANPEEGLSIVLNSNRPKYTTFHEVRHAIELLNKIKSTNPVDRTKLLQADLDNDFPRLKKLFEGNVTSFEDAVSNLGDKRIMLNEDVYNNYYATNNELNSFLAPVLMSRFKRLGDIDFVDETDLWQSFKKANEGEFWGDPQVDFQNIMSEELIKNAREFVKRWKEYGFSLGSVAIGNRLMNNQKEENNIK